MFDRPLSAVPSSSSSSGYPPLNHQPKLAPQSPSKPMAYYNLQVIQLVECSPPQRRIAAIASPSFASSSSYSSSCSSASEEAVSSYCSSDEDDHVVERQHGEISRATLGDCYSLRMKRIQSWRDNFFASLTSTARDTSKSSPPALKRKLPPTDTEDDTSPQSSKRSRSHASSHSCPACDVSFPTRHALSHHGRDSRASDACRAAVSYVME